MALREILADFTIKVDKTALDGARKGIEGLTNGIKGAVAGLVTDQLVSGIADFAMGLADAGDAITDTAAQLGLHRTELQEWNTAAKLSGVEAGDMATAFKILQKNIDASKTAGSGQAKAFKALGVETHDASGKLRPMSDVLAETGIAIAKLPDSSQRTAKALELFGKAGTKLLPMFAGGEEGLKDLLGELERLGGGFSEDALDAMGEFGDNMDRWNVATTSLKSTIAVHLLPTLTKGVVGMTAYAVAISKNEGLMEKLKVAVATLGAIGAIAGVKMLLPFLPLAFTVAGIVLVVDELYTTIQGGDSYLNDLITKLTGKDASKSIFGEVKKDIVDLQKEIQKDKTGRSGIEITIDRIGASLKRFPSEVKEAFKIAEDQMTAGTANTGDKVVAWVGRIGKFFYTLAMFPIDVAEGIIKGVKFIGDAAEKIYDAVHGPIQKVIDAVKGWGSDIIDGLTAGITEGIDKVTSAAKSVGGAVKDGINWVIKRGSPSKMAYMLGGSIPEGFIQNFSDTAPRLREAAAQYAQTAIANPMGDRVRNVSLENVTHNRITVTGIGAGAVRQGLQQGGEESLRALQAAVEYIA